MLSIVVFGLAGILAEAAPLQSNAEVAASSERQPTTLSTQGFFGVDLGSLSWPPRPSRGSDSKVAGPAKPLRGTSPHPAPKGHEAEEGIPRVICTLQVLRADPDVDKGIDRPVAPPVDDKMVAPSPCRQQRELRRGLPCRPLWCGKAALRLT